jgi:hypothetical protein
LYYGWLSLIGYGCSFLFLAEKEMKRTKEKKKADLLQGKNPPNPFFKEIVCYSKQS